MDIESEDHAKDNVGKSASAEHGHSAFKAQYAFNCKSPANITSIEFGYFRIFAGAQRLDVNVVTAKEQAKFQATRAKRRIDLAGIM